MTDTANGVPPILAGIWTYRSFLSNPDINADFDTLEFGRGNIRIDPGSVQTFSGLIYGPGWELKLKGSIAYGNPFSVRFQGMGIVGGAQWIYEIIRVIWFRTGLTVLINAPRWPVRLSA